MTKAEITTFIKKHNLAVVATSNKEGNPQAAVVEFAEYDNLTIIIDTLTHSRKYKNLQLNKHVAIVIGWDEDITVQIDAQATELSNKELEEAKEIYFKKNAKARKWENNPDIAYFALKPKWLRYSDVSKEPWFIEEFSL